MTRISVVIPVFNGANYLKEAVESAFAQTHTDTEVIVVNDGSTDGGQTDRIARAFGDRIRYFSKTNGGVASALNVALERMTGQWFCWLSHDDLYHPEKLRRQLEFAQGRDDVRIVGCNFEVIDSAGGILERYEVPKRVLITGLDVLETYVFGGALMIRRECLTDVGGFNVENRTTQDLEMWLRLVERDPIWWMPDVLCQVRQHAAQGSRVEESYGRDKDDLFARIIERYPPTFFDSAALDPETRASAYRRLAEDAMRRQAWQAAALAFDRESAEKRSPALMVMRAIGPRRLSRLRSARAFVRGKLHAVIRRLRSPRNS